jgi:chemotaxis protein methyltransferase CheR
MMSADASYICKLVRDRSGIVLGEDKQYLLEARLAPLAQAERFAGIGELVARLRLSDWSPLHYAVVDAMTTNETYFFRDVSPFAALRQRILPEMITLRARERALRIWCAACSTGQEAYSILMTIREHFPQLAGWNLHLLATDISTRVLARAQAGRYTQQEAARGLDPSLLSRHFIREGNDWVAHARLREAIEWREMNLLSSWFNIGAFDLVFVRNVMIYFDIAIKRELFGKLRHVLKPDGYLFLGGAESPLNIDSHWVRVPFERGGVYRQLQPGEPPSTNPRSQRYPAPQ